MRIKVNTRVLFSEAFIAYTGQTHFAGIVGRVTAVRNGDRGNFFARVLWPSDRMPLEVNPRNLAVVSSTGLVREPID